MPKESNGGRQKGSRWICKVCVRVTWKCCGSSEKRGLGEVSSGKALWGERRVENELRTANGGNQTGWVEMTFRKANQC